MAESAVVASPDPQRGHVVKAYVRCPGHRAGRRAGRPSCSSVRERLSAYAYPRKVEFVDDLPKTLTGKIRRSELRKADAGEAGWLSRASGAG